MILDPYDLVAEALQCSRQSLNETSRLGHHSEWDSFGHLNVMLALEKHYGIVIDDNSIKRHETMMEIVSTYNSLMSATTKIESR